MSLNLELAGLFLRFAQLMEIKGEPVFKAIAFSRVGRLLENLPSDIREAIDSNTLGQIEGIGASSRKIIIDYAANGRSTDFDEVAASVPAGLVQLLEIPSLGPKTISLFWKQRGVTSLGELIAAIDSGALDGLKGIGPKKIQSIKEGIAIKQQAGGRRGIVDALPIAERLLSEVRALPGVRQAEIAGSLRRWRETIGDVDLIAATDQTADANAISKAFTTFTLVEKVLGQGTTKASVLVEGGMQVDLRIVPFDHLGAALQYFTGSKEHNVRLRGLAQDRGLTLNEWGLYRVSEYEKIKKETGKPPTIKAVASKTEAEIYKALGLDFIEPELRENHGEIAMAAEKKLPKLIARADIRGDLHSHTRASDGQCTIEQMAAAAMALGYEYLGITDHSRSQVIANGLSIERLLKHVEQIRSIGSKIKGIRLFAGCEVDILADGALDYDEGVLKELDFVVCSPHVSLKQDAKKATDRIMRAIDSRYVNIIGHPTGRQINARAGLPIEIGKVVARAAQAGVALEINAGWPRLDLNDVNARAALGAGAKLSINTDAHSIEDFEQLPLGLSVARRAGASAGNVINTFSPAELVKLFSRKR